MKRPTTRTNELGGARLKFIIVIAVIAALAYAASLYIPVAYNAYLFKDLMQQKADAGAALGHPPGWVQTQLQKSAEEYDVPADAQIEATQQGGRLEVHVQFTKPIEFPGYVYDYNFDHTAKSTDFLTK